MKKKKRNLVMLSVLIAGGILAWAIFATRITILPPKKPWLMVTDDLGREVTIYKQPETIVSLAPSNTEILFALGLGDKVIAVSEYCNYPLEVQNKTKIGGFSTVNIEKVVDLEPDLVLATGGIQEAVVEELGRLGLTVITLAARSIEDVFENIRLVGKAAGQLETARELTTNLEQRIKAVTDKIKDLPESQRPRVFYEVEYEPLMTAGPGTFIHHLIHLAGGVNIASDAVTKYPVYNLEILIERNPEVIIISLWHGSIAVSVEGVKSRERWQIIDAVKNNRVYAINADIISRPGPRIVDALEEIARFIYPALFKE
ncbi:cobalamin-binding protein [Candidatus Aerophobetes bacterium]|uniref:Cobalamin-binding protein n=1 Tax=Aerophobetes bacterium TaxID=2030807 RepID=A0A523TK91_UNCAE|nr:MAG: cobalamin-binding protein [Candidatus Aerophobetes bacterium]